MTGSDSSPTRSAFLELQDERQVVREGFEFLDEKRVILAREMLRRLADWQSGQHRYLEWHERAVVAMARALGRHGLDGLEVYPPRIPETFDLGLKESRFLGVTLVDGDVECLPGSEPGAVNPSPEARRCAVLFGELAAMAVDLSVQRACLERLIEEYKRTERRARALENVVLPEIDESLDFIGDQLEAVDQEEAIRVRTARG